MPDPATDASQPNVGLPPDQIDPAYGAITRGPGYYNNPLLGAQPPAPAPAPAGYTRPQSTYSSPFAPQGQTPQVVAKPYWNQNLPPAPQPTDTPSAPRVADGSGSGTTTAPGVPPSGAGTAGGVTTGDGLLAAPPLASGVDWSDEQLQLRERIDAMWRAIPDAYKQGTRAISGFRTYDQQAAAYGRYQSGQGGIAAPPGHSWHEKGLAIDWQFDNPAAGQWMRDNASKFGLEFPQNLRESDPNHMQLAKDADQTNYDIPLLQKTVYRLESNDGKDLRTSPEGAAGPMQIKPDTFRQYAKPGESISNPQDNINVGNRILADLYKRFGPPAGGDMDKVLIAYQAGENHTGPLSAETQAYLDKAHKLWNDGAAIDVLNGTKLPPGTSEAQARADALGQERVNQLRAGLDALTARINAADPLSADLQEMMRQHMRHANELQKALEQNIFNPPKHDQTSVLGRFGSLAVLVGIFGGMLSRAPLTASLGAAGAAMEAINQGDYDRYQENFRLWQTQTSMIGKALEMQQTAYSDILQNAQFNDREKWERIQQAATLLNDRDMLLNLEQGNAQAIADRPMQQLKLATEIAKNQGEAAKTNAEAAKAAEQAGLGQEYGPELAKDTDQHAIARGIVDKQYDDYVKGVPAGTVPVSKAIFAKGAAPDALVEAHQKLYPKAGGGDLYQVTWDGKEPQILTKTGNAFTVPGTDQPVNITGATSIIPVTKAQAGQQAAAAAVSPSTVQYWSRVISAGGQLPPGLGRTAQGAATVRAVMNAVGESGVTPEEFISRHMAVKANQTSLTNMTRMADASTAFENTAIHNFDQALKLAPAVIPTDWPWLNRWVETGQTQFGDIETPAYVTALLTAANEYAKVMTGATGAQGSTVDARREAAEFFSPYLNKGQINRVVEIAKNEMENRKNANYDMVKEITSRIGGGATTGAAAPQAPARPSSVPAGSAWSASRKQWRSPDGKLYDEQGNPL